MPDTSPERTDVHTLQRVPILLLHVHSRCNCRCGMCDIWKRTDTQMLTRAALESQLASILRLGVEHVVFTGGEPLLHPNLGELTEFFRQLRIRLTLLTSGLLLERYAALVADSFDDVIVSLDGPPATHDQVRGVSGAFRSLERGVRALRSIHSRLPIHARCTVQQANFSALTETAQTALRLGLCGISYLAADVSSSAFNRELVWPRSRRDAVSLQPHHLASLDGELERLEQLRSRLPSTFAISDSPAKLQSILSHFRADARLQEHRSPRCNAPWVSAVWEVDGRIRPCFFQPAIGDVSQSSLEEAINNPEAVQFRSSLDIARNEACRHCVCSLNLQPS